MQKCLPAPSLGWMEEYSPGNSGADYPGIPGVKRHEGGHIMVVVP